MDDEVKAAGEIAKTVGKGIDAAREAGGFLAKYIGGPIEQAMGIVEDRLKYARWERKIRLLEKANEILKERGPSVSLRPVPLDIAIPIVEEGSLQENDNLQDIWAQLLANAADGDSNIEIRRAFLTILRDLSPIDAINVKKIYDVSDVMDHKGITTIGLPDTASARSVEDAHLLGLEASIEVSMRNLVRLGLVEATPVFDGGSIVSVVHRTALGREFVRACSGQKRVGTQ